MHQVYNRHWYRALSWILVGAYLTLLFLGKVGELPLLPAWLFRDYLFLRFLRFNVLAFLLANAISRGSQKRRFWAAFALGAGVGLLSEGYRALLGLQPHFSSWLVCAAGSWAGAYLYLKSETLWRKHHRR